LRRTSSFNSLCEIPCGIIDLAMSEQKSFQFSLWDSDREGEAIFTAELYFQFSLWDSFVLVFGIRNGFNHLSILFVRFVKQLEAKLSELETFNSLCEIRDEWERGPVCIRLSILFVRFPKDDWNWIWSYMIFQFSLWDSD